jgi:hypothetical protein
MRAWEVPGEITAAGRIAFVYREDYLGGALFMALPSGRLLTYPRPRWRDVEVLDKDKKPTGGSVTNCRFGAPTAAPSSGTALSVKTPPKRLRPTSYAWR